MLMDSDSNGVCGRGELDDVKWGDGKKACINISIYNVGGGSQGGLYNTEKTSRDSTVSYYAHGQRAKWGIWGYVRDVGSQVNIMLLI